MTKLKQKQQSGKREKPTYSVWQNTGFMLGLSWNSCRSVMLLCLALAGVSTGKIAAELFIAPVILEKVEMHVPLLELVAAIIIFSVLLFILSGLKKYIDENTLFGRIFLRKGLLEQIGTKMAKTSYCNLMDMAFIDMKDKAADSCSENSSPTEHIWAVWSELLTNVLSFVIYLAVLSALNPILIGIVIVTTVIGYFVNRRLNEWGYRHKEEEASYIKKMNYICRISTDRDYAKDIRIFRQGEWLNDVWYSTLRLYQGFLRRREKNYIWINVVDLLMTLLRNGISYGYLIWLVLDKGISASQFLLYFNAASGFTQWITGILDNMTRLRKESMEISVLREFLEWPEPYNLGEGSPLPSDGSSVNRGYEIRLEDVSYRYPKAGTDTISHMNLTIHRGEKLAIVGLNGAGKTTLVKLVCGLLEPTQGRVLLDGTDIREYNREDYYRLFSAVFQDFSVIEGSVAVNVAQCVDTVDEALVWRCLEGAGLTEKVNALPRGIDTPIGRKVFEDGVELSGGQLQRLMLARALYKNGGILILDEPTAALDPIAENDIYIKYSQMTEGKTSLFISHRLASTRFCDRILYMEDGKIVQEGTHEVLLAAGGGYAGLFGVQSRYYKESGRCADSE